MKVRYGFVSNSSSMSFCIFGLCLEKSKIADHFIEKKLLNEEDLSKEGPYNDYSYDNDRLVEKVVRDRGFDWVAGYDSYYAYIGLDIDRKPLTKELIEKIFLMEKRLLKEFPSEKPVLIGGEVER